jgi:hypothetical protein
MSDHQYRTRVEKGRHGPQSACCAAQMFLKDGDGIGAEDFDDVQGRASSTSAVR